MHAAGQFAVPLAYRGAHSVFAQEFREDVVYKHRLPLFVQYNAEVEHPVERSGNQRGLREQLELPLDFGGGGFFGRQESCGLFFFGLGPV
jgi:hypothetical protein